MSWLHGLPRLWLSPGPRPPHPPPPAPPPPPPPPPPRARGRRSRRARAPGRPGAPGGPRGGADERSHVPRFREQGARWSYFTMPCSSSGWGRSSPPASSSAADVELLLQLGLGFSVALQPINLFYCFVGVFIGTLVGVLPGIGPVVAMSLLLPATFKATPEASIIMLAGIYYGAMYGGSTTSILVNIPGEAASVVTCLDGYQMARQGRAGAPAGVSAIGSFIGGTASIVGLMALAPPLSTFALKFGPAEYFSLMVLGLTILIYLAHGSMLKALLMAAFGIVLGLVGLDAITAQPKLTFDRM